MVKNFNLRKHLKSVVSGITAAAMLFTITAISTKEEKFVINAAQTVVVNPDVEYQNIQGFGGINHPEWTGSDLSSGQRQTAFGNGSNQLGMTVLRVFINPDKNQWYKAVETAKK